MAETRTTSCYVYFIICTFISWSCASPLDVANTKSNRLPKGPTERTTSTTGTTTATFSSIVEDPELSEYRVNSTNGNTCILIRVDGLIEVSFIHFNELITGSEYLPSKPSVEGNCKDDDTEFMKLTWPGHSLIWYFAKTPGGERWYISNLELTIDSDLKYYRPMGLPGKTFQLANRNMLIPTSIGKSYYCSETKFDLTPDEDDKLPPTLKGVLMLRQLHLQPFMYRNNDFDPPYDCAFKSNFRDEAAPIAVGSTLALAVILTIGGYAAFRYFKVKKFQYNTMG